MSNTFDCSPCCPTVPPTLIPGLEGMAALPATNGADGLSAFTVTTAGFVIPAIAANVTVAVASSLWMTVGQKVFASDGTDDGTFEVVSKPGPTSVVLKFMGYTDDSAPGATIDSGAGVSPSGTQQTGGASAGVNSDITELTGLTTPLSISQGGTSAITKSAAQSALGLGDNPVYSEALAVSQVITATPNAIAGIDLVIPALGVWQLSGHVSIDWAAVTFAASRDILMTIRNITQAVDLQFTTRHTGILATDTFPTIDYVIRPVTYSGALIGDHLQIFISVSVINSAGTFTALGGRLNAAPLRKT